MKTRKDIGAVKHSVHKLTIFSSQSTKRLAKITMQARKINQFSFSTVHSAFWKNIVHKKIVPVPGKTQVLHGVPHQSICKKQDKELRRNGIV